jgi:putative FmdB family regulatory protein
VIVKAKTMPLYDFKCTNCGHQLELIRKMSDASVTNCPNCQQETFAKMLSAPNFQLNGSGWYVTDFKDKNTKKPNVVDANATKTDAPKPSVANSVPDKAS